MNAYHPDDTGMIPADRDKKKDGGKKHQGGFRGAMMSPFMPGQRGAIAGQLSSAFGGGGQQWNKNLSAIYAPFRNAASFPYESLMRRNGNGNGNQAGDPTVVVTQPGYPYYGGR